MTDDQTTRFSSSVEAGARARVMLPFDPSPLQVFRLTGGKENPQGRANGVT